MLRFLRRKIEKPLNLKEEKVEGHLFRYYENPLLAPYQRQLAYFQAQKEAALGVGEEDLDVYIELTLEALRKSDTTRAIVVLEVLKQQSTLYASWRNTFRLANPIILLPDEPLLEMSPAHSERKEKLCQEVPAIQSFFLSTAWATLTELKLSSTPIPPLAYIRKEEVKAIEKLFLNYLSSSTSKSPSPD